MFIQASFPRKVKICKIKLHAKCSLHLPMLAKLITLVKGEGAVLGDSLILWVFYDGKFYLREEIR
jgi:hypothetical protein